MSGMAPMIDIAVIQGAIAEDDAAPPRVEGDGTGAMAEMGGECVFLGRIRGEEKPDLGRLVALDYEVYSPMAERIIAAIALDAARAHGCGFVGVRHSAGAVRVGSVSVIVRALARGRTEAFGACREVVDRLKREAPIWKRERWERGIAWHSSVEARSVATAAIGDAGGRGSKREEAGS